MNKLTPDMISAAEGRELDALVAEHVCGWVWRLDAGMVRRDGKWHCHPCRILSAPKGLFAGIALWDGVEECPEDLHRCWNLPAYSTNPDDARDVHKEMGARGFGSETKVSLEASGSVVWSVTFKMAGVGEFSNVSGNSSHAVCRAALAATATEHTWRLAGPEARTGSPAVVAPAGVMDEVLPWTSTLPTVPGWYWHRQSGYDAHIADLVYVYGRPGRLLVREPGDIMSEFDQPTVHLGGQWAGPIPGRQK